MAFNTSVCRILSNTRTKESILNKQNWIENLYHPNTKTEDIYRRGGKRLMRWRSYKNDANLIQRVLRFSICTVQCNVLSVLKRKKKKAEFSWVYSCTQVFYSSLWEIFIYNRTCLLFKNFKSSKSGIVERTVEWAESQDPLWIWDKVVGQDDLSSLLYITIPWFSVLQKRLEGKQGNINQGKNKGGLKKRDLVLAIAMSSWPKSRLDS